MYKVWSRTGATGHIIRGLFSEALMQVTNGADDFEFYLIFIDFNPNIDLHLATILVWGRYLNDVRKIFGILDPLLPPLSRIHATYQ